MRRPVIGGKHGATLQPANTFQRRLRLASASARNDGYDVEICGAPPNVRLDEAEPKLSPSAVFDSYIGFRVLVTNVIAAGAGGSPIILEL